MLSSGGQRTLLVTIQAPGADEVGLIPAHQVETSTYDKSVIAGWNLPFPDLGVNTAPGTGGARLASQYAALADPAVWLDGITERDDPQEHDRGLRMLVHWAVEPDMTWPTAKAWHVLGLTPMTLRLWRKTGVPDSDIPGWAAIEGALRIVQHYRPHLNPTQAGPWIKHAYGIHGSVAAVLAEHGWTAEHVGAGMRTARNQGVLPQITEPAKIEHLDDQDWEHALLAMAQAGLEPSLAWSAISAGLTGPEAVSLHARSALNEEALHLMAALRTENA